MPCRVSSDAHEWINEGPTVPAWYPVNPRNVDEQSTISQREEKTPWSFTAACCWDMVVIAECRRELLISVSLETGGGDLGTPPFCNCVSYRRLVRWDNCRWAVWLGRHPLEKISRGPKDQLRRDRNPPQSAKVKAGLTESSTARDSEAKAGLSEHPDPHWWGLDMTEKLPRG
jgi:hypothetical protein